MYMGTNMWTRTAYQHLAEFRYQIRRFLHFRVEVARQIGAEPQQHQLLLAVKGTPPGTIPTIQYLANRLFIQHNSAVELVNRSVKKGLVERQQDLDDLRRVTVRLTPKGDKLVRALTESHQVEMLQAATEMLGALQPLLAAIDNTQAAAQDHASSSSSTSPIVVRNKRKNSKGPRSMRADWQIER